jgi:uncharacterized protein (DUF2147 family)
MRSKSMSLSAVICFSIAGFLFAADSISGTWKGEWGPNAIERSPVSAQLKYDGKTVTGTLNSGFDPITISKGSFNEKTGAVHLEAEGKGRTGGRNHYVIDGKLQKNTISGTWKYEKGYGDFTISMQ